MWYPMGTGLLKNRAFKKALGKTEIITTFGLIGPGKVWKSDLRPGHWWRNTPSYYILLWEPPIRYC